MTHSRSSAAPEPVNVDAAIEQFRKAAAAVGLELPTSLVSGKLTRCKAAGDKRGERAGRYLLHLDYLVRKGVGAYTGYAVAVAGNVGNLLPVAEALRAKQPGVALVLCADDDDGTAGNPGVTKATAAAAEVGGILAVPRFPPDRGPKETDFTAKATTTPADASAVAVSAVGGGPRELYDLDPDKWLPSRRMLLTRHSEGNEPNEDAPFGRPVGIVAMLAGEGGAGKSQAAHVGT